MLNSEKIKLRSWKVEDVPFFASLKTDKDIQFRLMAKTLPFSYKIIREWLEEKENRRNYIFFVIADLADRPVGFIQAQDVDEKNKTAFIGICIGPNYIGQGFGHEAVKLFEAYLRISYNIVRVMLYVLRVNTGAISFYKKLGFERVAEYSGCYHYDTQQFLVDLMEKDISQ